MATSDCQIDESVKQALVGGDENDTTLLMRGYNTLRVFKNRAATEAKQVSIFLALVFAGQTRPSS